MPGAENCLSLSQRGDHRPIEVFGCRRNERRLPAPERRLLDPLGVPSDSGGLHGPHVLEPRRVDTDLVPTGLVRRLLKLPLSRRPIDAPGVPADHLGSDARRGNSDLSGPLRERVDESPRDADDVGLAVFSHGLPLHPKGIGQLGPKGQLVHRTRALHRLGATEDLAAVERPPSPVFTTCPVCQKHVGVELGVAFSARAVGVRGADEPTAVDLLDAVPSAPGVDTVPLQIHDAGVDGCCLRCLDLRSDLRRPEGPKEADGLRG